MSSTPLSSSTDVEPDSDLVRARAEVNGTSDGDSVSVLSLANVLLRHSSLLVGFALLGLLIGLSVALLRPRHYTATALFAAQSRNTPNGLSGLAAQIGLAIPTGAGGEGAMSPQFYADLVRTQPILRAVAESRYALDERAGSGTTLVELYGAGERSAGLREEKAVKRLDKDIDASLSPKTGVVTLNVTARSATLSKQIAARLLELLNQFNLESRQSRAGAERRFTERRLEEVRGEMRVAEGRLQDFLQRNRDYRNSPGLQFEHDRLQQEVNLQQTLFTTLAQSVEQSRIEEVRDTPVLTVIAPPTTPVSPDSRGLPLKSALGLVAGLMLGLLISLISEFMRNSRVDATHEYVEFASLRRAALSDMLRPWRPLGRLLGFRTRA